MDYEQRLNQLVLEIQDFYSAVFSVAEPFCGEKFKGTRVGEAADYMMFIQRTLREAVERATAPEEGSIQGDLNA